MNAPLRSLSLLLIEPLESRIAPALLSLAGSALTYTADAGIANDVAVIFDNTAAAYSISDPRDLISLTPAASAAGFSVSANGHTVIGPVAGLNVLTIDLGDGNDRLTLFATATPVVALGGSGDDSFAVGKGGLLFVAAGVTIDGGGGAANSLAIDDSRSNADGSFTIAGATITHAGGLIITSSNIQEVLVEGGFAGNTFRVQSVASGATLRILGNDASDQFIIGNAGNSLASIAGQLSVDGRGGADRFTFNDRGQSGNSLSTLTEASFTSGLGPAIQYSAASGDSVVLNLRSAAGAPLLVPALAPGVEYFLNAGPSGSQFLLGNGGANSLGALLGHATIAGAGSSIVAINESAGTTAHSYAVAESAFSRDGVEIVTVSGVSRITLAAGSGDDRIDVVTSALRIDIDAGAGSDSIRTARRTGFLTAGPGTDTLIVTGIVGDATLSSVGLSGPGLVAGLVFQNDTPEFVKLAGTNGPNHLTVTDFPGFTILDGGGGTDTFTGGDVLLTGKTGSFTDPAGNLVTLQTDKGRFTVDTVEFLPAGLGASLIRLDLAARPKSFANANIAIHATRGPLGGDGFTAVGLVLADNLDLASLTVKGDLGALQIGDADPRTRAISLLRVNSLGLYADSYLPGGISPGFDFAGKAGRLEVATVFVRGLLSAADGAFGKIGSLIVGGDLSGQVYATGRIGQIAVGSMSTGSSITADFGASIDALTIHHDLRDGEIYADGTLGPVNIGGALVGSSIIARGHETPANPAASLALASVSIGGDFTDSFIGAGYDRSASPVNPDVAIGSVVVGGNFNRSDLAAGLDPRDGIFGNGDDLLIRPAAGPFAHVVGGDPAITARIARVIINGGVFGAPLFPTDHNALTAQRLGSVTIGGSALPLTGALDDFTLTLTRDVSATEVA